MNIPRLFAFNALMLLGLGVCTVVLAEATFSLETDLQALFGFKSQVSENKREVLASWNHSSSPCNWIGVKYGRKQERVTSLDLGGFKLSGSVSPSIGNLSFLVLRNLADNSFESVIPQVVGMLFRLRYLNISYNLLEGRIPPSLSNCSKLSTLDLSSNHLGHEVPSELGSLSKLATLYLNKNNLSGKFPASLGNLTSLEYLDFAYNHMGGKIPVGVARLPQMVFFQISINKFSGVFPPALYNISSLVWLSLANNSFSGNLRGDFCDRLPNLKELLLGQNQFIGAIPITFSNISSLERFHIAFNYLTGSIPLSFRKLSKLLGLGLGSTSLGINSFSNLEFIDVLANCTQLEFLDVDYKRLRGELPASIANLSTRLTSLSLGQNLFSGSIPLDIGNLISLEELSLETTMLTGEFPVSFGKLSGLEIMDLYSNAISGEIPPYLVNMTRLHKIHLNNNSLQGRIPQSLGRCQHLLDLWIATNSLNGTIPLEILQIPSLAYIDLSRNSLTSSFAEEVGKLDFLVALDVSYNELSGQIPQTLRNCLSMEFLQQQSLWSYTSVFGKFSSAARTESFYEQVRGKGANERSVSKCFSCFNFWKRRSMWRHHRNATNAMHESGRQINSFSLKKKVAIGIGIALLLLFTIVASLCWFIKKRKKNNTNSCNLSGSTILGMFFEKISYEELYIATSGFTLSKLIGSGNFSDVFKGFLGLENTLVAVKVLNLLKHGAMKSFMAECETFKGIRHRNLVKLLTVCSSLDTKEMILELWSMNSWLEPEYLENANNHSRSLTLAEKLSIAIDVASALEYLHFHCHDPVAHCDVKPSNILLDNDLTAHVSDFGLARLLYKYDRESFLTQFNSVGVRGIIGYAAPGKPKILYAKHMV